MVDGVHIPAVTHWYYGVSHLNPQENAMPNPTKQFGHSDMELFENVYRLGRKFIDSASVLPFLPVKEFTAEETRFDKSFEKARACVEECSPLHAAYLCDGVRPAIAGDIVSLSGE